MKQDYIKRMSQAMDQERSGDFNAAEATYREILSQDPGHSQALNALAIISLNKGDLNAAYQLLVDAVKSEPNNGLFHQNLGEVSRRLGNLEQAILCGKAATKLLPSEANAFYNLGLAYTDAKDYKKAITAYRKAVKLNPKHGFAWNNLGSALEAQDNKKSALAAYEAAVAINPGHGEAQNNCGAIYSELGKLDEACTSFNAAIEANPAFVEAHYNLSSLKKYTPEDPHLAFLEGIFSRRETLPIQARIRYAFAMGKALDDIGKYDQAFAAYQEGNRLQHSILPVDEVAADTLVSNILQVFTPSFFEARKDWHGKTNKKRTPIFIVGMPRSGTTLLEQILSSHASVFGAGELVDLNDVIQDSIREVLSDKYAQPFITGVELLSEQQIKDIGKNYLDRVWKLSPKSIFITDKMPANFFYLGLIHLALPNAKIIHAMRDPMDSCFSCYSRLFNDTMEFAYDIESLGNYYKRYITLMKHWHSVLPAGSILDVSYEGLVEDTEGQARRILEFVGLPWDSKCLEFHKNERLVKTASITQVRKPIYKSSIARWKHFKKHLQPLLQMLAPYRQADNDSEMQELDTPNHAAPSAFIQADITANQAQLASKPMIDQILQLQGQGQHQQVVDQLVKQVQVFEKDPNLPVLLHLLGISLYRLYKFSAAQQAYEKALQLHPSFPSALNSYGFLLQDLGQLNQAKAVFQRALDLAPEMAMARLNLGMVQLKLGDFENGLENYEARWTGSAESTLGTFSRPDCPLPLWSGEEVSHDKSLLIITEQGFGDTFQFVRYLPELCKKFRKIAFACSLPTLRLMEWSFSEQVTLLTHLPKDYATWDYQCSLMSLPRLCQTRVDTIPNRVPYLRVPSAAKNHWHERLQLVSAGQPKIGIAWAGRAVHQYDSRRSMSFSNILPLLEIPGITWVSLQKWAPQEVRPSIPQSIRWIDWTEELQDFGDTAALVDNLDLVISIDSSMVHLAGALNRPVWMMNRFDSEWRWFSGREDSPWYPSLRIFNQTAFGDWQGVIQAIRNRLIAIGEKRAEFKVGLESKQGLAPTQPLQQASPTAAKKETFSVDQGIQIANQLQVSGRLSDSEKVLRQILQVDPKHAHALHLLGVVTYQAGQAILALDLIRQAIAIQPNNALFESNLAEMLRQQGRVDEAIAHGERAVDIDPMMASAHSNLGIALFDKQLYDQAEAEHLKALAIQASLLQSINNLGSIERARKNLPKSIEWYRKALSISPEFLESSTNLGAVLVEDDQSEAAVDPLIKVLNVYPNSPEALCNLGLAYYKLNDFDKAISLLRRSLESRPGYSEAMIGLARVLHETEQGDEAEVILQRVLQKNPSSIEAWSQLGAIYTEGADLQKAEDAYLKVIELDSKNADALTGIANLRMEAGSLKEAEDLLQQALQLDDQNLGARFHLAQVKKVGLGDANLQVLESSAKDIQSLSKHKQIFLHYALGKAYDDLGEYDKAFPEFQKGAALKRQTLNYKSEDEKTRTDSVIQTFTPELFERLKGQGNQSNTPIFVLGMPRSGTTLTEQIIASHPSVYGAGELRDYLDIVSDTTLSGIAQSLAYGGDFSTLTPDLLDKWGSEYIARIQKLGQGAHRITDKMPANYLLLGLIPLTLPNAQIVHVKRDPIDTCLSCFTRLFNRHQSATYDLAELGQHYLNYHRLMEHWRRVLPANSFIEVEYESLISDTEVQAKRLIQELNLEWDPACLDFYKNERRVRTASVTQVRQPIYKSSVERWRHYEQHLQPLLEQLKPIL